MSRLAFLTGGTGFVGANLARELLADGWRVRALVRPGSDQRNLAELPLEIVPGDLADPDLAGKLAGADALFHVAALYSLFRRDRAALETSNVVGTRRILAAARAAGVPRTVYTSSVAAIGVKSGGIADETYQSPPERLIGAYKRSKFFAEREADAAVRLGQDVVIVNPTTPIGPWDRKPTPTGEILVRLLRNRMPAIVNTGLNFVDVRSVARGHIRAFESGRTGQRYILGGVNLSLKAFLGIAARLASVKAPKLVIPHWIPFTVACLDELFSPRFGRVPSLAVDSVRMSQEAMYYQYAKANANLGYSPGDIEVAVHDAIQWFIEHDYGQDPKLGRAHLSGSP